MRLRYVHETEVETAEDRHALLARRREAPPPACVCKHQRPKPAVCRCFEPEVLAAHYERLALIYKPFPATQRISPRLWAGTMVADTFYGDVFGPKRGAARTDGEESGNSRTWDDASDREIELLST